MDEKGQEKCLYKTNFTYFMDEKTVLADVMLRGAYDELCKQFPVFSSADDVREFDMLLTEAMRDSTVPENWSMVMGGTDKGGETVNGKYSPKSYLRTGIRLECCNATYASSTR